MPVRSGELHIATETPTPRARDYREMPEMQKRRHEKEKSQMARSMGVQQSELQDGMLLTR